MAEVQKVPAFAEPPAFCLVDFVHASQEILVPSLWHIFQATAAIGRTSPCPSRLGRQLNVGQAGTQCNYLSRHSIAVGSL